MISLAEVLARHWPAYERAHGAKILPSHRRAVQAIRACRTPALGGQKWRCEDGHVHLAFHSCNHRSCPQCGYLEADAWIARHGQRLLPGVPYFLLTFTVPAQLRPLFYGQQKKLYNLLLRESAAAVQDLCAQPKYLGGEAGLLAVLHTWSRPLAYHPHVHVVVPGGGLTPEGGWSRVRDPEFFLHYQALSRCFRNRFERALKQEHPQLYAQAPVRVWHRDWVVHLQAVGQGEAALKYLARYVYRTALGKERILSDQDGRIAFNYRRSSDGQLRRCELPADQFITRILQHTLPKGFQRVRYYGWLSPAAKAKLERIRTLLDWRRAEPITAKPRPECKCPECGKVMVLIGRFQRGPPA